MPQFFPNLSATRLQAATYLLGIALFSIAFLVFLNSSISFVITDVIGQKEHVGNAVGTLGFADELLALVACPVWGLLSDRIGVRTVAVLGYCIVGLSLILLVQSSNVYPQLLLGRLGFSLGGAACSTMVTAILPAMVIERQTAGAKDDREGRPSLERNGSVGHIGTPSVSSEITITPTRYSSGTRETKARQEKPATTSQLAGFVGLFTGAGALVALGLFLPMPAWFQNSGISPTQSVQDAFYIVGAVAFCVAVFIFVGLRRLPGEEGKSLKALINVDASKDERGNLPESYLTLVTQSVKLGFTDSSIGIGYLGGFVARASSVGISLFIPLFVNHYFVHTGLCKSDSHNLPDIKENCARAYKLAAALTGIAETAALIGAPLFGYFGARAVKHGIHWPLLASSLAGILGYVGFGLVKNPDAFHGEGDSKWALVAVIAIGISQIGSIVCSLAVLGRGVADKSTEPTFVPDSLGEAGAIEGAETAPLLPTKTRRQHDDRSHLRGSIAGVYSLGGGAGILLLTKLGGALFDAWSPGAPFFIMAIFNAVLMVAIIAVGLFGATRHRLSSG